MSRGMSCLFQYNRLRDEIRKCELDLSDLPVTLPQFLFSIQHFAVINTTIFLLLMNETFFFALCSIQNSYCVFPIKRNKNKRWNPVLVVLPSFSAVFVSFSYFLPVPLPFTATQQHKINTRTFAIFKLFLCTAHFIVNSLTFVYCDRWWKKKYILIRRRKKIV